MFSSDPAIEDNNLAAPEGDQHLFAPPKCCLIRDDKASDKVKLTTKSLTDMNRKVNNCDNIAAIADDGCRPILADMSCRQ